MITNRLNFIEGFRAISVWAVILFHLNLLPNKFRLVIDRDKTIMIDHNHISKDMLARLSKTKLKQELDLITGK